MHRLRILSDLHLERSGQLKKFKKLDDKYFKSKNYLNQTPQYLALLGDIGNPYGKIYQNFLYEQADNYEKVFVLAGNHEFYSDGSRTYHHIKEQIHNICDRQPNLFFLDNNAHSLKLSKNKSITILGSTLWTDWLGNQSSETDWFGEPNQSSGFQRNLGFEESSGFQRNLGFEESSGFQRNLGFEESSKTDWLGEFSYESSGKDWLEGYNDLSKFRNYLHFHNLEKISNDLKNIYLNPNQNITGYDIYSWHQESLHFIREYLETKKAKEKIIILTHHSPSYQTGKKSNGEFHFPNGEKVKNLFYTNLEPMCFEFHKSIHSWCYGHTHIPFDRIIANVRMVSNPMGYYPHLNGFGIGKFITLTK